MSDLENMKKMISSRIKSERITAGYKQSELSRKIGKADNAISGYETGDRLPPVDVLYQLSEIFNCSSDYLLGRSPHRDYRIDEINYEGDVYKVGVKKDAPRKATIDDVMQLLAQMKEKEEQQ